MTYIKIENIKEFIPEHDKSVFAKLAYEVRDIHPKSSEQWREANEYLYWAFSIKNRDWNNEQKLFTEMLGKQSELDNPKKSSKEELKKLTEQLKEVKKELQSTIEVKKAKEAK